MRSLDIVIPNNASGPIALEQLKIVWQLLCLTSITLLIVIARLITAIHAPPGRRAPRNVPLL